MASTSGLAPRIRELADQPLQIRLAVSLHGATDEVGFSAVEERVHNNDLHATILHLMGLDHEKLTYRYSGRDFRLTDVYGNVVNQILA